MHDMESRVLLLAYAQFSVVRRHRLLPPEVQFMVKHIPTVMACQVEVGMLGQVDQGWFVCAGINQHLEHPLFGHNVGDTHLECAWVSLQHQTSIGALVAAVKRAGCLHFWDNSCVKAR